MDSFALLVPRPGREAKTFTQITGPIDLYSHPRRAAYQTRDDPE